MNNQRPPKRSPAPPQTCPVAAQRPERLGEFQRDIQFVHDTLCGMRAYLCCTDGAAVVLDQAISRSSALMSSEGLRLCLAASITPLLDEIAESIRARSEKWPLAVCEEVALIIESFRGPALAAASRSMQEGQL